MKLKIAQKQTQKTILAPSMQQSIEVLLLPITDLETTIEQKLQENPLLEVDETKKQSQDDRLDDLVNLQLTRFSQLSRPSSYETNSDDDTPDGSTLSRHTSLEDHLLQQLRLETNDPVELQIGELIIGNLNEDGYLKSSCEEIAQWLNLEDTQCVEKVLKIIQNFDPTGIASRHLKECLLAQVHHKFNGEANLVEKIICDHLEDLGGKKYIAIAQKLKISPDQVKSIAKAITSLEPKPARKYMPIDANIYIKPDVSVTEDEEGHYQININNAHLPQLRINVHYQRMLKQPNRTEEEVEFIREKIKNALLFIRSVEQRHQTIKEISQYIVDHQKAFFAQGSWGLKPMTLKDVATKIERNESTVSRAINNKYMDTPQGLYPIKFFFSQAVCENSNGSVSNQSIKEEIKTLIETEDKASPLSDQAILQYIHDQKGVQIARRTVSKYRQALKILPSHLRKV